MQSTIERPQPFWSGHAGQQCRHERKSTTPAQPNGWPTITPLDSTPLIDMDTARNASTERIDRATPHRCQAGGGEVSIFIGRPSGNAP